MIIDVPIRRVSVRVNGAQEDLLELQPGFWLVRPEKSEQEVLGNGHIQVSNPLIEVLGLGAWTDVGAGERIYFRLTEPSASNPGLDNDSASLSENLATIV